MSALARTLALALILASGCSVRDVQDALEGAPALEVSDERVAIQARVEARVPIDALMPSDLQPLAEGGFAVLDGYGQRIFLFDAQNAATGTIVGDASWGQPVRLLPEGDGYWLTDPGSAEDPGGILRINSTGAVVELRPALAGSVAVARPGDSLVISNRDGTLQSVNPTAPGALRFLGLSEDAEEVRLLSDVIELSDGTVAAIDVFGSAIHLLPTSGEPLMIGRFGHHVGALRMPKAIAEVGQGDLAVVDSVLGVVQVFDRTGKGLGPLVGPDGLLRFDHPVAVRVLSDRRIAVLSAGSAEVVILRVEDAALAAAHMRASLRHLRVSLAPEGLDETQPCIHCHDGFAWDSRANWDPEREHHPVDVKPEGEVPAFFQLDDDGKIQCRTCHSPHGEAELGEVRATGDGEQRLSLVRHQSAEMSFLRVSTEDSELCLACHEDAAHGGLTDSEGLLPKAKRGPGHLVGAALADALARRPDSTLADVEKGSCLGCHAVHAAGSEPLLRAADAGATCLGCHEDHARASRNHPLGRAFGGDTPQPGLSARLVLGPDAGIGCITCHDVTDGRGDDLLRTPAEASMLCLACHENRKDLPESGHGKIRPRGGRDLPACLGCHDVHGSSKASHLVVLHGEEDPTGCRSCHEPGGAAAKRGLNPGILGHPVENTGEGDRAIADCTSCHDVHDVREPTNECADCHGDPAASFARGGHGEATCLDCHPAHRAAPAPPPSAQGANPSSAPCLACHAEDSAGGSEKRLAAWSHPETVFMPDGSRWEPLGELPLFDTAGSLVPAGQNGSLACRSCHLVHGPAADGNHDELRRPEWKATCAACHGSDALPLYRYFHDPKRRENAVGDRP